MLILTRKIDQAIVMAHQFQVDQAAFLELVKQRLTFFERKLATTAEPTT